MSVFVACPSCEHKLRVPEELLGKKVKCPTCATTFEAQAPPEPEIPPTSQAETLNLPAMNLPLDDEPASPQSPPLGTPQSVSPTPPEPPGTPPSPAEPDLSPCPYCGERIRKMLLRCPYCEEKLTPEPEGGQEEEVEEDRPWERGGIRRPQVRRDCEPHRSSLVLILGIVSIPLGMVGMCCGSCTYGVGGLASVVGLALGICSWVMGNRDLAKMRAGVMDPAGESQTQSGMICGIVGTSLNALGVLISLAMLAFILVMIFAGSMAPAPPPRPIMPPPQPQPRFQLLAPQAGCLPLVSF